MNLFSIDAYDFRWINGSAGDLCLHGHAVAFIGETNLEYDCTVSATALYLLKSLTEDHIINEDNQMLPCCGHSYFPDKNNEENIVISGCPNGIDWTVKHDGDTVVLIPENGVAVNIPMEVNRRTTCFF